MRRLARHLFTLCSVASLLLCVAVCVLWVRSYFVSDHLERPGWKVISVKDPGRAEQTHGWTVWST